jgi:hypothetical protein
MADITGSITAWSLSLALREPSSVSDAGGRYWFSGMPTSSYRLRVAPKAGWRAIGDAERAISVTAESEPMVVEDFGLVQTNAIYGRTFIDLNGNNARDGGEPGLASATVYIDANENGRLDAGEPHGVSDSAGRYRLSGLTPGVKLLRQAPLPGYTLQAPTEALLINLEAGATITGQNFANLDGVAPTVVFSAEATSASAFESVTIAYSEVVSGFSLANLALTRNGEPIALQGVQLSNNGAIYVLSGLEGLTQQPGRYRLRLESAAGIADLSGNTLAGTAEIVSWFGPTIFTPVLLMSPPA